MNMFDVPKYTVNRARALDVVPAPLPEGEQHLRKPRELGVASANCR
jgi:hypothetical protein